MIDPLEIMNEFMQVPDTETPNWPVLTPFDDYWGKRVAALCERCAKAENELEKKSKRGRPPKTKCFLCEETESVDICRACYNRNAVKSSKINKSDFGKDLCDCMRELLFIMRSGLENNPKYEQCKENFAKLFAKMP